MKTTKSVTIKAMVSSLVMSLSVSVLAQNHVDAVFKKDSPMPPDLQERVLKVISERCKNSSAGQLALRENKTQVTVKYVDQIPGDMDFYFKTVFSSYYDTDSGPPMNDDTIIVFSEKFSVSHPEIDPLRVNTVVSVGDTCLAPSVR